MPVSTSIHAFSHVSGAASTGALGFDPLFFLYVAAAGNTLSEDGTSFGWGIGTAVADQACAFGGNSPTYRVGSGDNGVALAGRGGGPFGNSLNAILQVSAFSSANITLTWDETGRNCDAHQGFMLAVSTLDSPVMQASVFNFSHLSGSASTGALGFTPRIACYVGAIRDTDERGMAVGFATGTGASAKGAYVGSDRLPNTGAAFRAGSDADAIGGVATSSIATTFANDLDVTAFGAANITLAWASAVDFHDGHLLVIGD